MCTKNLLFFLNLEVYWMLKGLMLENDYDDEE